MKSFKLRVHEKPITWVQYNREGDLLFVSSKDTIVTVWFTSNGELLGSYKHEGAVNCIDVNADTTRLIAGVASSNVVLWEVKNGKRITDKFVVEAPVKAVQFADGGKRFLAVTEKFAGKPAAVSIFEIPEECLRSASYVSGGPIKPKLTIQSPSRINCAVWGDLNETIICGSEDGVIRVYDSETGKLLGEVKEHKGSINKISMSKDKTMFITASADNTAKLFETRTLELIKTYKSGEPVNAAAISPTKYHVILGGGTQAVHVTTTHARTAYFETRFYNMVFEEEFATVKGHFGPIHALSFSPDGKGFASGGEDGIVRLHHFGEDYLNLKEGPNAKY